MKTDIALHEIARIDEQDEAHNAENSGVEHPTPAEADRPTLGQPFMKSEESLTHPADDEIVAREVPVSPAVDGKVAEQSSTSLPDDTTAAAPVMTLHDLSSNSIDTPTQPPIAEKSSTSPADDTTAAAPVLNLHTEQTTIAQADPNLDANDSAVEIWSSIQNSTTGFIERATAYLTSFYKNNRRLLTTLGIILVAILGIDLLFAGLNAIDDLPLVTPILKLIGLVYVVRFAWRYLLRERDRQELAAKIDRAKADVFGSQN